MSVPKKYALSAAHIQAFWSWHNIKNRCNSPSHHNYERNHVHNAEVCPQWEDDFFQFYADMGPPPGKGYTIDRFPDIHGNYEPGNCRWATTKEQSRNKTNNVIITHNGLTMCTSDWSVHLGGTRGLVRMRMCNGWSQTDAVSYRKGQARP